MVSSRREPKEAEEDEVARMEGKVRFGVGEALMEEMGREREKRCLVTEKEEEEEERFVLEGFKFERERRTTFPKTNAIL